MRQPEFRSYIPNHGILLNLKSSGLFPSIAILILSASIWTILSRRQRLRSCASLTFLNQLRGPPSQSWLQGNYTHVFSNQGWDFHKMLADNYGSVVRIMGPLRSKQLYTFDPKAMYRIFIKQGTVFQPHGVEYHQRRDYLWQGSLEHSGGKSSETTEDAQSGLFHCSYAFNDCGMLYPGAFKYLPENCPQIDLLGWMARTALELIGQSGLGYSFDDMMDDVPKHRYSVIIKDFVFYVLPLVIKVLPKSVRVFLMNILPWRTLHNARDMANYMHDLAVQIYQEKKHALEEGDEAVLKQIGKGKDLLSILIHQHAVLILVGSNFPVKANMKADSEDKLEELELIGQMSTFIFAAMDTTSDKLRDEVVFALRECGGNHLSYDELMGLPYLDAICRETLRLSTEDTIVPFSQPVTVGKDGKVVTEVFLPKGTTVFISILNANRNPDLWGPDALPEWKPERWLSPLPEAVTKAEIPAVYSHLMTFIGGGRSCIGFKFSQLETKVVIAMLVENFKFSLAPEKEIFWQMSLITSPVVGDSDSENSDHPQLPLIVELAK
ncbi:cytochrome P450 [Lentinula raphanica]|nr:cytochrome P450 [Lentinula raphanica]